MQGLYILSIGVIFYLLLDQFFTYHGSFCVFLSCNFYVLQKSRYHIFYLLLDHSIHFLQILVMASPLLEDSPWQWVVVLECNWLRLHSWLKLTDQLQLINGAYWAFTNYPLSYCHFVAIPIQLALFASRVYRSMSIPDLTTAMCMEHVWSLKGYQAMLKLQRKSTE